MTEESYIQIPPDSSGKMLRHIKRTVGTNEVYEKTILVAEPVSGILIDPRFMAVLSGTIDAKVSGEIVVAKISGETVIGKISGETLGLSSGAGPIIARISGETVVGKVSGEVLGLASGTGPIIARISGETIRALSSGETYIAKVSGETIIAKVSGEIIIGKVSGEVVSIFGYSKAVVSGAVIRNIINVQAVLHTVTINDRTSGFSFRIRDSVSGAVGTIIAQPYSTTRSIEPSTLIFDCVMLSGIVVDTSGATWNITVTYR